MSASFVWECGVATHCTSGFADSYEEAIKHIRTLAEYWRGWGVEVTDFRVIDPQKVVLISMETFSFN